jgi:hypothetical protein
VRSRYTAWIARQALNKNGYNRPAAHAFALVRMLKLLGGDGLWCFATVRSPVQASYLNDKDTRALYSTTLPLSIFRLGLLISATRK